jgi:hypothetical protein
MMDKLKVLLLPTEKSIIITKKINTYLVLQKIKIALIHFESEYQLSNYRGHVLSVGRNGYLM